MDVKKHLNIEKLLRLLHIVKLVALLICIGAFGWKVYDSYVTFMRKGTGTNIEIVPIRRAPQTNLALCRDSGQIFNLFDGSQGDLKSDFNLTVGQMNLLQAYKLIEQKGKKYEEVFESFLFRDPRVLRNVTVVERGDRRLDEGYSMNFDCCSSKEFSVFVHPIYGFCFNYLNKKKSSTGINYVKIEINLEFAFPQSQPASQANIEKRNKREADLEENNVSRPESSDTERSQKVAAIKISSQRSQLQTLPPKSSSHTKRKGILTTNSTMFTTTSKIAPSPSTVAVSQMTKDAITTPKSSTIPFWPSKTEKPNSKFAISPPPFRSSEPVFNKKFVCPPCLKIIPECPPAPPPPVIHIECPPCPLIEIKECPKEPEVYGMSVGEIMPDELSYRNGLGAAANARFYFNYLREQEYRYEEPGFGLFNVIAFSPGQFLTSKNLLKVSYDTADYYTMYHEVIDKVRIKHVQECEDDEAFDEDSCLYACLAKKFVARYNCFHARLKFIESYSKPQDVSYCDFESLYRMMADKNDTSKVSDPGIGFIQKTLDAFEAGTDESNRCNCPIPCIKQKTRFQTWKSVKTNELESNTYAVLKYGDDFKVYSYHMLYTGSDFLADIGGYLGLFLGLSVFGLVDLISKVFNCKKEEDEQVNKVEDDRLREVKKQYLVQDDVSAPSKESKSLEVLESLIIDDNGAVTSKA